MSDPFSTAVGPQRKAVEASIAAAGWLHDTPEYDAGLALVRTLATAADTMTGNDDPEIVKQLHMRVLPNLQRALETMALTPTSRARMLGSQRGVGRPSSSSSSSSSSQRLDEGEQRPAAAVTGATPDDVMSELEDELAARRAAR